VLKCDWYVMSTIFSLGAIETSSPIFGEHSKPIRNCAMVCMCQCATMAAQIYTEHGLQTNRIFCKALSLATLELQTVWGLAILILNFNQIAWWFIQTYGDSYTEGGWRTF
jgi:hypothetical protein